MISPAVRLRATPSRPEAQNAQPMAQPTCVLMQTVQCCLSSRSNTHSIRWASCSWRSSFSVPSAARRCWAISLVQIRNSAASCRRKRHGQIGHFVERRRPLLEEPLPHLSGRDTSPVRSRQTTRVAGGRCTEGCGSWEHSASSQRRLDHHRRETPRTCRRRFAALAGQNAQSTHHKLRASRFRIHGANNSRPTTSASMNPGVTNNSPATRRSSVFTTMRA